MSNMQAEVYQAFRAMDVPEDKALRAAEVLGRRDEELLAAFHKGDDTLEASVKKISEDTAGFKTELRVMQGVLGLLSALQVATFIKLFVR